MQGRQSPPSAAQRPKEGAQQRTDVSRRFHLALHLVTAALVASAAWMLGSRPELAVHWWRGQRPLLAFAATLALLGVWPPQTALGRVSRRVCVVGITVILAVAALELFFRALGHDFRRQTARLCQLPPFYLRPGVVRHGLFPPAWADVLDGPAGARGSRVMAEALARALARSSF